MSSRRLAIVAGLGVVELWIIGLMIHSVAGSSHESEFSMSPGHHPYPFPAQAAMGERTARRVETGPAPHVVIADDHATLTVSVRPGATAVDVREQKLSGWVHGDNRPLGIEKTSDGVRIARADGGVSVSFGFVRRRLDVVVPPAAQVEVQNAGSTVLSGLRAAVTLHSDDGSIVVSDQRGAVVVKTDNGKIELHDVDGPSVEVASDNGHVVLDRVRADRVSVITENGHIEVARSLLRGGKLQTNSGRIRLGLDPQSDVTISAHASSGKVVAESPFTLTRGGDDDDAPATIRVGNGAGHLDVGSDDGNITVLAGGV